MPLGMEVGLSPGNIVLDGDPAPPKKHSSPQFLAHVCCGQTAGWIKMPLGTEVDLAPGHTVLDGDPAPLKNRYSNLPQLFGPSIVAKLSPISATAELLSACLNHSNRKTCYCQLASTCTHAST